MVNQEHGKQLQYYYSAKTVYYHCNKYSAVVELTKYKRTNNRKPSAPCDAGVIK